MGLVVAEKKRRFAAFLRLALRLRGGGGGGGSVEVCSLRSAFLGMQSEGA